MMKTQKTDTVIDMGEESNNKLIIYRKELSL